MTPDPRWLLEILKARGWQTAAVSIACALLLWANRAGWLPPFEPWMVQLGAVAMVICGLLALASLVSNATIQIKKWSTSVREWLDLRHSIKTLNTDEIAFLKGQVKKGKTTAQLHPFNAGGIPNFVHRTGMYQGLHDKKIVYVQRS
jgi:hypothetical protein